MQRKEISLAGVFTPIVTPFDEQGRVAHDKLAFNLEKWNQTELAGYIVWALMVKTSTWSTGKRARY